MEQQQPTPSPRKQKGGLITMPFIIANEAFEKVSSYGLLPNMILYLMKEYKMGVTKGTNIIFFWSAATNFMPLVGAFLSDSYMGRFLIIGLGSITSLLGTVLLWLTAMIRQARPPPCDPFAGPCKSATQGQYTTLILSFLLISVGAGGIRPCSLAFGADQLDKKENPKNERVLESYFGWYYVSAMVSVMIALTGIVYIQDHLGWKIGFGIPAILMLLATVLFFLASPLYIKQKVTRSLFTSFAQVIVAAYKNRKLAYPPRNSSGWYHHKKDSMLVVPTDKLRFLNKACIIRTVEDNAQDAVASNSWSLCTVGQVEELKALAKVIPLWSTGIMMSINISQSTFPLLQAKSMDRHISKSFQIPAGSFGMFTIIAMTIWIILYDRVIIPLASKMQGKPFYVGVKVRLGIGLFFSCMSMVAAAIVEHIRRRKAIQEGYRDNPSGIVDMSAMWLVPHHCFNGLAEAFNAIGQTEFFYSELPKSMSSIAAALFGLGTAVANLLASVILSTVNNLTKGEGKESWVSSDINKGHYDYYYWLLAIMSLINLLYFLIVSWAYGPCVGRGKSSLDVWKDARNRELSEVRDEIKDEGEYSKEEQSSTMKL